MVGRERIGTELEFLQIVPPVAIGIDQRVRGVTRIKLVELFPPVRDAIAVRIRRRDIRSEIDPQFLTAIGKAG